MTRDGFRPGLPLGPYANLAVAGPLAVASSGALYVADVDREQIRWCLPDGRFRVVAGDGTKGVSGDGGPVSRRGVLGHRRHGGRTRWESLCRRRGPCPGGQPQRRDLDHRRYCGYGHFSAVLLEHHTSTTDRQRHTGPFGVDRPAQLGGHRPERTGRLYISTGMQLLRLDTGTLDVIATRAIGPPYNGEPLADPGQIAVDALGNVDVSGGNGWAIWQVAPNGVATEIGSPNARRSGGDTSVLERAADGVVYGESGSTFLKLQGSRAIPGYSFPQRPRSGFWLTYFAFGPDGTIYADEIPGFGAWEAYQQLRVVRDNRSSVLWQQTSADASQVARP